LKSGASHAGSLHGAKGKYDGALPAIVRRRKHDIHRAAVLPYARTLMRIEIDTHLPVGKPSTHRVQLQFQSNPKLLSAGSELPATAKEAIQEQFNELRNDSESMLTRALVMQSFSPVC
jgi:hypothetical protein